MMEVIEMMQTLQGLGTDAYMQFKYAVLAVSREHQETDQFMREMFSRTDERRPLLIGMKEGGAS